MARTRTIYSRPSNGFSGPGRTLGGRSARRSMWSSAIDAAMPFIGAASVASGKRKYNLLPVVSAKKTGILKGKVTAVGTGGQMSRVRFPGQKLFLDKSLHAMLAPYYVAQNSATQILGQIGQQGLGTPFLALTAIDIANCAAKLTGAASSVNRVFMDRVHAELLLCNNFIANATVTIYDVMAREDINSTPANIPSTAWSSGDGDESGSAVNQLVPGTTPFDSELFNQYWKVIQTERFILAQGAQHRHVIDMSVNRLFHMERVQNSSAVRDATIGCIVVVSGQPSNDSTTKTQVSLGKSGLDIVQSLEYEFRFSQNHAVKAYATNSLPTAYGVAEELISTGLGTTSANTEA